MRPAPTLFASATNVTPEETEMLTELKRTGVPLMDWERLRGVLSRAVLASVADVSARRPYKRPPRPPRSAASFPSPPPTQPAAGAPHSLALDFASESPPAAPQELSPEEEAAHVDERLRGILSQLASFTSAPFTVQRMCELVLAPEDNYTSVDGLLRALEIVCAVTLTRPTGSPSEVRSVEERFQELLARPPPTSSPASCTRTPGGRKTVWSPK